MTIHWTGKVVSVNQWHALRWIYEKGSRTKKKPVIAATKEYEEFINSLSATIAGVAFIERMIDQPAVDLRIQCSLGPRMDDQNLLKPICDAIERSGVVKNDRNIGIKTIVPGERHKQGQDDHIWLFITRPAE